jgi:hypothetical protein
MSALAEAVAVVIDSLSGITPGIGRRPVTLAFVGDFGRGAARAPVGANIAIDGAGTAQ